MPGTRKGVQVKIKHTSRTYNLSSALEVAVLHGLDAELEYPDSLVIRGPKFAVFGYLLSCGFYADEARYHLERYGVES
jgi:hypothetical protein